MKISFHLSLYLIFSSVILLGQSPQPMPSLILNQSYLQPSSNDIHNYGPIETNGAFNVLQGAYTDLVTTKSIIFKPGASVKPHTSGTYSNNKLTARIEKEALELAWFAPSSPGWVKQHEKLEIGIKLPVNVEAKIQNFIDHQTTPNSLAQLNPFNPEHIDIKAEFYLKVGNNWVKQKKKFGFFYEEFHRNTSGQRKDWDWKKGTTNYRFRLRFTPKSIGEWKCRIFTTINKTTTIQTADFHFNSYFSNNSGFMTVSSASKKYFRVNGKSFFPIGQNLHKPMCYVEYDKHKNVISDPYGCIADGIECPTIEEYCGLKKANLPTLLVYEQQLTELSNNGANYFRFINFAHTYYFEWEKLGNYYGRMDRAWELDRLIEKTEALDLKMQFSLIYGANIQDSTKQAYGAFNWDWSPNNPKGEYPQDKGNCYGAELGITTLEFLTDIRAHKHFKNNLRYLVSRWGHSSGIAIFELMNEINLVFTNKEKNADGKTVITSRYPKEVKNWQLIMAAYLKNDLECNQLIAVDYGDEDLNTWIINGDHSFLSNVIDIRSINKYGDRHKFRKNLKKDSDKWTQLGSTEKPFIYGELGIDAAEKRSKCDRDIEWIKDVWHTPFIGSASIGLNWHNQHNNRNWIEFGKIQNFLDNLDFDNYTNIQYDRRTDQKAEMLCRKNTITKKAIGVISNTTWNYWSGGIQSSDCQDGSSPLYKSYSTVRYGAITNRIKVTGLGSLIWFKVEWFDPNLNNYVGTIQKKSNLFGDLELEFPLLTNSRPTIGFKVYPSNASFMIPAPKDSSLIFEEVEEANNDYIFDSLKVSSINNELELVNESINKNKLLLEIKSSIPDSDKITVFPNPTSGITTILLSIDLKDEIKFISIVSSDGKVLHQKNWNERNPDVDLSKFSPGTYYIIFYSHKKRYIKRIIKQ